MKKIILFLFIAISFFGINTNAEAACEINNISFSPFSGDIMTSVWGGIAGDYGKETTLSITTNGECDQLNIDIKEQTFSNGETTSVPVEMDDKPATSFKIPKNNILKILYHTSESQCDSFLNSGFDCQLFVEIQKPNGDLHSTKNIIETLHSNGNPTPSNTNNLNFFSQGVILAECDGTCGNDPWEFLGTNAPKNDVCEIGEAIFSPNGNSSTGTTVNIKLLPKDKTTCADKPLFLKVYEYDPFEDNQIDSFWYNPKKLKLDSNGEFQASLRSGEDECEGEDICEYYIEGSVGSILGTITKFSTDLGNEKNLPDPYKGRIKYTCNGDCNDKWQVLSINPNNLRGGCTVDNITINPTGFQTPTDATAHSYINKTNSNNPKIIVKVETTGCYQNSVPIEIEPYEYKYNDRDVEEVTLKTGLKEDGILNLVYVPGDTDCAYDASDGDNAKCEYAFQVDTDTEIFGGDEEYESEHQANGSGKISWLCTNPGQNNSACNKTKWKLESHDGVETLAEQANTVKPSYDKDSPCHNGLSGDDEGYLDNCYELLANIPGIGETDPDTGRVFIRDVKSYSLGTYINQLFQIALGVLMVLAVIMIVIAGVQYMTVESIYGKSDAKKNIIGAVTGLILSLGIFVILNTINPRLLNVDFGSGIDKLTIDVPADPAQTSFIEGTSTAGVVTPPLPEVLNYEPLIGYLYHQQGPGGAPTTLWAAKNGYSSVPTTGSPFISGTNRVQKNINAQFGRVMTPTEFVEKFYRVLKAKETKINNITPSSNGVAVAQAANAVGVDVSVLKTICMIESYDCSRADVVNSYGYTGLFQFHPERTWPEWRESNSSQITNPYDNSYAGAKFLKSNLQKYQSDKNQM